jgi:hypothetical protein
MIFYENNALEEDQFGEMCLFNDTVSSLEYVSSNGVVIGGMMNCDREGCGHYVM